MIAPQLLPYNTGLPGRRDAEIMRQFQLPAIVPAGLNQFFMICRRTRAVFLRRKLWAL